MTQPKWGFFREIREKAEEVGYKVVRIPYFFQLSDDIVKQMFGRKSLFDSNIPSLDVKDGNTPAYCCPAGLKRMVYEFRNYSELYQVNLKVLKKANNEYRCQLVGR